jgi:predicted TIM-barrel fold metal-dependent hydrolase
MRAVRKFDSLVHATPDGRWLSGKGHDARLETLVCRMDEAGVERACLVAIAGLIDNEWVARAAKQHPRRLVPIGSIDPVQAANEGEVERAVAGLRRQGFAGLKLHPRANGYDPLESRCLRAIRTAGQNGLVVYLDTLFRQRGRPTCCAADIVDRIVNASPETRVVLLHGGGTEALDLFELVRLHANLVLDLSFTLLRYAGSSLDLDLAFLCRHLDQRLTVGSDFPEYQPAETFERLGLLTAGLDNVKRENIFFGNLSRLFAGWDGS